jgi:hypothetical protein
MSSAYCLTQGVAADVSEPLVAAFLRELHCDPTRFPKPVVLSVVLAGLAAGEFGLHDAELLERSHVLCKEPVAFNARRHVIREEHPIDQEGALTRKRLG